MNYYQARQRKIDQRWDWTQMNDGHVVPVGYCAGWPKWADEPWTPKELIFSAKEQKEAFVAEMVKFKEHYHTGGHATPEEAAQCFKKYCLDRRMRFHNFDSRFNCRECGVETKTAAEVFGALIPLCQSHATREMVDKHYTPPTQVVASY